MDSTRALELRRQITSMLQLREELTQKRHEMKAGPEEQAVSNQIQNINEDGLPILRKRILAASKIAKDKEKHELLELLGVIDGAKDGIGTYYDLDISEAHLDLLKRQQAAAKSHREAKRIAKEITAIEWARSEFKKQKEARAQGQPCREKVESEIRRLDELLYGHLSNRH